MYNLWVYLIGENTIPPSDFNHTNSLKPIEPLLQKAESGYMKKNEIKDHGREYPTGCMFQNNVCKGNHIIVCHT